MADFGNGAVEKFHWESTEMVASSRFFQTVAFTTVALTLCRHGIAGVSMAVRAGMKQYENKYIKINLPHLSL